MKRRAPQFANRETPVHVLMDRNVYSYIAAELAKRPDVEEGGKYVGYLLAPSDPSLKSFALDANTSAMVVTDFLPSGPNATRTAVELQPDGEYQEALFRELEYVDPAIEHLGTWHSHHCNGLQTLSKRDVDGYYRTVNKAAYRPDYLLASLVTRLPRSLNDAGWIDHFLFVRGRNEYYQLTDSIRIIDWPSAFWSLTDHAIHGARVEQRSNEEKPDLPIHKKSGITWYETREGRTVLAEDKRFFAMHFGERVVATRREESITMTGRVRETAISITYPARADETQVVVIIGHNGAPVLHINADLTWRLVALKAALAGAETLP